MDIITRLEQEGSALCKEAAQKIRWLEEMNKHREKVIAGWVEENKRIRRDLATTD